jgi:hypothetical protein
MQYTTTTRTHARNAIDQSGLAATGASLCLFEGLGQVGQQVIKVLDTDRKTHQRIINTKSSTLLGRNRSVGHDGTSSSSSSSSSSNSKTTIRYFS